MGAVQFSQEAYDRDNNRGCKAVRLHLEKEGWTYIPKPNRDKEDRGIDLMFFRDGDHIFVEVAVQHTKGMYLPDLNDYKRKSISILEKKLKYGTPEKTGEYHVDEVTEIKGWYGEKAWIYECNEDCTQAFVIQINQLDKQYMVTEIRGRGVPEDFIEQPTKDFKLIELST